LTAFASDEARARMRDAGFQEHLVKPVHIEALLATVSRLPRHANVARR
jgi:DNA-binding response OmpR family regulator